MLRVAAAEGFPVQEQPCPTRGDIFSSLIADAYQAECERFDAEMESADGDACACRDDLRRAARTSKLRALADRLIKAEGAAAGVRNRGVFMAGIAAGIRIAGLTDLTQR